MYLVRQGGKTDYNYKEYYLDTKDELSQIPTFDCCPGSVAYIINSTDVYMLSTSKEWVLQDGSGGDGGSDGGEGGSDSPEALNLVDEINGEVI